RAPEEIEEARKRDPVKILAEQLQQIGALSDDLDKEIHLEARKAVDEATDQVDSAPYPGIEDFYEHVYAP
ncbi:MAG: thiamine pyrophosphate-dependent enzyme, partial [SAR202 cluster bacterium]|nr:thiamine pyrophosphate-dependent enzyme [SAR202 cluster bacterium]